MSSRTTLERLITPSHAPHRDSLMLSVSRHQSLTARRACWQISDPEHAEAESQLLGLNPHISARYLSYALLNPQQYKFASPIFLKVAEKDPTVLGFAVAALQSEPPKGEALGGAVKLHYDLTILEIAYLCERIVSGNLNLISYIMKGLQNDENRPVLEGILSRVGRDPHAINYIAFGLGDQNPKVLESTVKVLSGLDPEPVLNHLTGRLKEPAYLEGTCRIVKQRGAEAIKALLLISTYFGHQPDILTVLQRLGPEYIPMAEKAVPKFSTRRTIEAVKDTLANWKGFYQQPAATEVSSAKVMCPSP